MGLYGRNEKKTNRRVQANIEFMHGGQAEVRYMNVSCPKRGVHQKQCHWVEQSYSRWACTFLSHSFYDTVEPPASGTDHELYLSLKQRACGLAQLCYYLLDESERIQWMFQSSLAVSSVCLSSAGIDLRRMGSPLRLVPFEVASFTLREIHWFHDLCEGCKPKCAFERAMLRGGVPDSW